MPDAKISDLPAGGDPQDTDEFVVARGATNVSLAWSSLSNAATAGNVALTLDGNTAGALALVSSGTLTLAGGNNITLSQAGNAVTISGANAGGAQTGISGLANSETTYTSGTVNLSELGAITIRSTTGQAFQFSVNSQTVQTQNLHNVTLSGNTAGALAQISSGTLTLAGGNNITLSQAGNAVTISGAAQSVQPETQTFIAGISASDTLYTSGNVRFSGSQAVTVRSGTGQLVIIDAPAQSVQPETQTFIGGIAASNTTYTSGTVTITGVGGGITVSSNTGQRIDLSVAAQSTQTQGVLSIGVSTGGNTSGNTTVNTGSRFVIVGSNGITASQGTAAGATTVTLSGATQTVQTQGILSMGVSTGGNTIGNTQVSTGSRFVLVASGNATASQATAAGASTVTISVGTQTLQTQGILSAGVSTGGNTSGDTGVNTGSRLVLAGGNNITLSQATAGGASTITISAGAGGAFSAGVSTGGNSFGDTGVTGTRLVFEGREAVVLTQFTDANGGTIRIGAPAMVAGMSTLGNTSGNTGYASERLNLVGGNNITLSGSTNGGFMSITISAPNLGAGAFSGGASNLGNTAGDTGITGTRLVLVGSNNITLSQATDANGGTLSFIGGGGGGFSAGVSTGGNTAGATGVTGTRLVMVGTGDVTLSQTTDANGGTISFIETALSHYDPTMFMPRVTGALAQGRFYVRPWTVPRMYVHDRFVVGVHYTQATNSTLTVTVSAHIGLYTRNAGTLSMLSSQSGTFSINGSGTASSAANSGIRNISFPWTNTVPAGDYWLGFGSRTTTAGNNATLNNMLISQLNSIYSGFMGQANNGTHQLWLGFGDFSMTTTSPPAAIGFSELSGTGSLNLRPPHIWFMSSTV